VAARGEWTSQWNYSKEDAELEHQLVLGATVGFDELLAEPPRPDEGWELAETTRLGRYARRMWDPLLAAEEVRST
jgi:exodeoxyribonuclease V gamma subunit